MIKKYQNSISLIMMIIISCATQIFTLLKSSIVAGQFGTSMEMDAYNFANSIVSFIFGFMASAVSTVIIPSYLKKTERKEVDSFITAIYLAIGAIIAVVIVLRYKIVGVFTNKDEIYVNLACNIMLVLLLANMLFSVTNVTAAHYQCIGKYNTPKIINLAAQMAVVGALIFLKDISIMTYAIILSAGMIATFAVDACYALKYGWRYKPAFAFKEPGTKKLFALFLPIIFSSGIYKLSLVVDSIITSRLETGQLSVLGYSSQISNLLNTVLIGNLLIYFYPKIVKKINEDESQKYFWEQTYFFHFIVCLVVAGFTVVGKEAIAILFERGNFNAIATNEVYLCALIYVIGQQIEVVRDLIYRYFYAVSDTKTPALNSVLVSVLNIAISLILVRFLGVYGVILGTVLASAFSLLRIIIKFRNNIGFKGSFPKVSFSFLSNIAISLITIGAVLMTKKAFPIESDILSLLAFGCETVLIYGLLALFNRKKLISAIKSL